LKQFLKDPGKPEYDWGGNGGQMASVDFERRIPHITDGVAGVKKQSRADDFGVSGP